MEKVLLYSAFALALSPGLMATTVTAEWVPGGFNSSSAVAGFSNGAFVPGQTFTALVTGLLESIGVGISSSSANNVLVSLWDTSGGLPNMVIAMGTIVSPQNGFGDGQLHFADMTANQVPPTLVAGTIYAITLGAVNSSPNITWAGTFQPNVYTSHNFVTSNNGGGSWSADGLSSAVFRVNVSPTTVVPEPSTWVLLATAGLTLMLRRRGA